MKIFHKKLFFLVFLFTTYLGVCTHHVLNYYENQEENKITITDLNGDDSKKIETK